MSNSTKLPTSSELYIGQWSLKGAPTPTLSTGISATATTIRFSQPFKDNTGAIVTAAFLFGVRKANKWTETCYCPAGGLSADGLTATGVVRGIDPGGLDYTVGDSAFADTHLAGEPVFCNIPAVIPEMIRAVLQGLIASGGSGFIIGTDASGAVTVKRSTGTGTSAGFLRWDATTSKVQFSNDGSTWTSIDDTVASVLFKVSATDTTPSYGENKIVAGSNIAITKLNTGANETLSIATSLPTQITAPGSYTPAYLTGGSSAESNYLLWLGTSDGTARFTIDGTQRDITCDFTGGGISDMDGIAAVIQAAIRTATGSTETCGWDTDHFLITSANTTVSSQVSVASATGAGTDISGAGAFVGLDADTGNGTATAAALDQTQDSGKVALLGAPGTYDPLFIPGQE